MLFSVSFSGGWDHVNPLTAPGRSSADPADLQEQVPQESLSSKAPDIVLQPPSAPESEEEDNNGETVDTAETVMCFICGCSHGSPGVFM